MKIIKYIKLFCWMIILSNVKNLKITWRKSTKSSNAYIAKTIAAVQD